MARDAPREGELPDELEQPGLVQAHVWIELAVRAFEKRVGHEARPAVPRAGDVDGAQVARADGAVQVRVDQVESGSGAEVAEEPRLDVLGAERLAQKRVREQVDLTDRGSSPRASRRRSGGAPRPRGCLSWPR